VPKRKTSESKLGQAMNLRITDQEAPTPSGLLPDGVEEPDYVLRGNKVKCRRDGRTFSTRAMYVNHFKKRHLGE
jgi:hypothetical protein